MALSSGVRKVNFFKFCNIQSVIYQTRHAINLQPRPPDLSTDEHYSVKNERIGRPLSPYVTIYAAQLTSLMSISHRFSGLVLTTYAFIFGIGTLAYPDSFVFYFDMLQNMADDGTLSRPILAAGKIAVGFPFAYHFCNGMRFLLWVPGYCLDIKSVYSTGYIALLTAIVCDVGMTMVDLE